MNASTQLMRRRVARVDGVLILVSTNLLRRAPVLSAECSVGDLGTIGLLL